jgi:hypothetical protein
MTAKWEMTRLALARFVGQRLQGMLEFDREAVLSE